MIPILLPMDRLIVMDDVLGPTNKSTAFASFLMVSQKFKYSCVFIFHIIYPEKSIWKVILSQMKHFNMFPGSVQHVEDSFQRFFLTLKIVSKICPTCWRFFLQIALEKSAQNYFWLNRFFVDLAKRNEKICFTLDCWCINPNGPGKYRTEAGNLEEQSCYFNVKIKKKLFNTFPSKRIWNSESTNEKKFIFKLNELEAGSEMLTTRLMLVQNYGILSAMAQAYLDMVRKTKRQKI